MNHRDTENTQENLEKATTSLCSLCLCVSFFLSAGCGPVKHPTGPMSGMVTWQGKPLTHGRVIFHHEQGHYGFGDIGPDGSYKCEAPVGACKVAITCREPPPENLPPEKIVPGVFNTKSLIPERYENHMDSGLNFEVERAPNRADWRLE